MQVGSDQDFVQFGAKVVTKKSVRFLFFAEADEVAKPEVVIVVPGSIGIAKNSKKISLSESLFLNLVA